MPSLAVVVPAGGRASRLDGSKLTADIAGVTLLDRTLDGLPDDAQIVCVGTAVPTTTPVLWVADRTPFAGPLAAVEAGVAALPATISLVVLVGGDMPDAGRAVPTLLEAAAALEAGAVGCAVLVDSNGRIQPLLSAWPSVALRSRLDALRPTSGRALSTLLDDARVIRVNDSWGAALDVDTPDDLAAARARQDKPSYDQTRRR